MAILSVAVCLVSLLTGLSNCSKPNIIFILLDDLGFSDVGWNSIHNAAAMELGLLGTTPTLDRLAQHGIRLNYHYSEPLCSPTRSSLLTGLYAYKTGVGSVVQPNTNVHTSLSLKLVPQILKDEGYATLMAGKYHIGYERQSQLPFNRGFDECLWYMFSIDFYSKQRCINWEYYDNAADLDDQNLIDLRNMLYGDEGMCGHDLFDESYSAVLDRTTYVERLFGDKMVDFINRHQHTEQPYFIYYASHTPHTPYQQPPKTYPAQCGHIDDTDRNLLCQMMLYVDELVAEMLQHITDDNTIIIFAGDNGAVSAGQNLPLRGRKASVFEGGIRSPAFIYSPAWIATTTEGCDYSGLAFIGDWFPTLLHLADIEFDQHVTYPIDGVNLWPHILQQCSSSVPINSMARRRRCPIQQREGIFRLGLCNTNGEKGDIDVNNSFFYSTYVRRNQWKLVVNGSIERCPSDVHDTVLLTDNSFSGYMNIFNNSFDPNVNIKPNTEIYDMFMASNKDFLYRSIAYDALSEAERNDVYNFLYDEIMLFNIHDDPIESTNIALQFPEIVDALFADLGREKQTYDARNRQDPMAISVLAQVESYDCQSMTNFQQSWADDPRYSNDVFDDWNFVWQTAIDQIQQCNPN